MYRFDNKESDSIKTLAGTQRFQTHQENRRNQRSSKRDIPQIPSGIHARTPLHVSTITG